MVQQSDFAVAEPAAEIAHDSGSATIDLTEYVRSPEVRAEATNEDIFAMRFEDIEHQQLYLINQKFEELRPKIEIVDRLATDLGVMEIRTVEDVVSLCLPHTFYKSYTTSDVEKGRFDRMTRWLNSLTALDLSGIDVSGCDSMESWLDAVKAQSELRPLCSSGTNGKSSFFPRSTTEEHYFIIEYLRALSGYRDELDSELASGEIDFLTSWPVATGNHNIPFLFRVLRETIYKDKPGEHVYTLGQGHWNVDLMWLSGRVRAAEAKGESTAIELAARLERLQGEVQADKDQTARNVDTFMDELIVHQRGRKVFLFAPPKELYALALECQKRGVKPEWAPDSFIFSPGTATSKGGTLPDGWLELCKSIFPFDYQGVYAMTECLSLARLCSAGYYHMPPSAYLVLIDPETSQPIPREGVQTGRLALFDLLPVNHWGGTITGDRVTIDWRGGCSCGRNGPFMHNNIQRFGNLANDDKITCSKSPEAYERAVEFVLGEIPE